MTTEVRSITIQELIAKVRELAAASPGNKYIRTCGACHYTKGTCTNGSCGCIFGQAFQALGWPVSARYDCGGGTSIRDLLIARGISCSEIQQDWMRVVQDAQDTAKTWSEAVGMADKRHPYGVNDGN